MVFPVVIYGCESWTVKKAEHRRIDALELWCRRRLLRVPWTARRSNQSILKEISPVCSLEGLMLKLKLQYFGHLMRRAHWKRPWCWEGFGAGGEGMTGWDGWMASLTRWTWVWVNSGSWWWTGIPGMLPSMGSHRVGHDWSDLAAAADILQSNKTLYLLWYIFSSVQSLICVRLFATPWIVAHQASLSITNSRSLLKLMCIESVMPSRHLLLCCPLLFPLPKLSTE